VFYTQSTSAVISGAYLKKVKLNHIYYESTARKEWLWVSVQGECLNWPFLQISPVFNTFISIQIQYKKTAMLNDILKKKL